jgi:hypothetical protein
MPSWQWKEMPDYQETTFLLARAEEVLAQRCLLDSKCRDEQNDPERAVLASVKYRKRAVGIEMKVLDR